MEPDKPECDCHCEACRKGLHDDHSHPDIGDTAERTAKTLEKAGWPL